MRINYQHELCKYAQIDLLKDGSIKVRFKQESEYQANIFLKLSELGYRRKTRYKFYLDGIDKYFEISQLNNAFIDYLGQMDLSFFNEKMTNYDVMSAFKRDSPIKRNNLTIYLNGPISYMSKI
jgi:hypothetical protein